MFERGGRCYRLQGYYDDGNDEDRWEPIVGHPGGRAPLGWLQHVYEVRPTNGYTYTREEELKVENKEDTT